MAVRKECASWGREGSEFPGGGVSSRAMCEVDLGLLQIGVGDHITLKIGKGLQG